MKKSYDPKETEQAIYKTWEKNDYFKPSGEGKPYCIMLPPPNVTGSLHMGHGFQHTLMDALIRYHRMMGFNTLWQPGVDHAGIATQMVVERQLAKEGKTRRELGREKFLERIWAWKEESGGTIGRQMRRMGVSPDWTREAFTMDENLSRAVRKTFIDLYDEGLIYRGKRLVNWDPVLHTAVSDLEVMNEEEEGNLWYFKYPFAFDQSRYVIIATTRPETMLGDTAVAIHPQDKRYQHLIGKTVLLPLANREIPIIADEYVDPEFGTGCVKITPAHDFNDYEVGQRHQLDMINILTFDAKLNENAPKKYQGMDRFEARKLIVADMKNLGLLEKVEPHRLKVPRGDRTQAIIEPWLTDQWFVTTAPLAKPAIEAVEKGEIKFIPENWSKIYFQWMSNIQDWCISRQLWWGHRIPAWYDEQGNIYVAENESEVRQKYHLSLDLPLHQDEDVLDTWFSSALWPFSTLGWPQNTKEFKAFYPTDVLVTAFDIIFFWVARMIMFGLKFTGEIPFHEVYITSLIRDAEGQKMSKSKGNILDPIDLIDGIDLDRLIAKRTANLMQPQMATKIEKATRKEFPEGIPAHGADALRFTFCALATYGRDINFSMSRLSGSRNFCNKLWNAARYVLMNVEEKEFKSAYARRQCTEIQCFSNQWILSRLQHAIEKVHEHFKDYRFDQLAQVLYEFTWHEYCDWYLELSKAVLTDAASSEAERQETQYVLISVLETILRLLHPLMPFLTEDLWQSVAQLLGKSDKTIMLETYPIAEKALVNKCAESDFQWIETIVTAIRNIRSEMNISPSKTLGLFLYKGTDSDQKRLDQYGTLLQSLGKLSEIRWLSEKETPPLSATALCGKMELHIPMAGLIDRDAEMARLKKEIEKFTQDLAISKNKLSNPHFVNNAPKEIVGKERDRAKKAEMALVQFKQQLKKIEKM
ncbi:MAG: valine--tRNA ligase [Gammaproteobacteria bacterium]|nr:valine--tRNA ligase [Gammaproteobacteria bacterium]